MVVTDAWDYYFYQMGLPSLLQWYEMLLHFQQTGAYYRQVLAELQMQQEKRYAWERRNTEPLVTQETTGLRLKAIVLEGISHNSPHRDVDQSLDRNSIHD